MRNVMATRDEELSQLANTMRLALLSLVVDSRRMLPWHAGSGIVVGLLNVVNNAPQVIPPSALRLKVRMPFQEKLLSRIEASNPPLGVSTIWTSPPPLPAMPPSCQVVPWSSL